METVEFAQFKIAEGVDEKEFLKASDLIMPDLEKQKGFLSRKLVKSSDDIWADIVMWETLEDALALAENFEKIESCHNYLGLIDLPSVKISHFAQIRVWEKS
jgi:heme-degrading monooxygenase HmoA